MINRLCFLTVLLLLSLGAIAQKGTKKNADVNRNKVFLIVENQPEFPGGNIALMEYLAKNIRYPSSARQAGIEGKVMIQFVVSQVGEVTDVKVLQGLSEDCDKEAMRLIKEMPDWKAGRQGGKPVNVQVALPINYHLK